MFELVCKRLIGLFSNLAREHNSHFWLGPNSQFVWGLIIARCVVHASFAKSSFACVVAHDGFSKVVKNRGFLLVVLRACYTYTLFFFLTPFIHVAI